MFIPFQRTSSSFSDRLYPRTDLSRTGLIYTVEPITYVTNGLIMYLDAGNPASYPGTGTTWTDLSSRGKIGTLTNGPLYSSVGGGCIVFDGSNDYVAVSGTETMVSASVCVWARTNGAQFNNTGIVFNRGGTATDTGGLTTWTSADVQYGWNDNNSQPAGISLSITDGTWQMWSFTHTPSGTNNRKVYVNTTVSQGTNNSLGNMTWSSLRIGEDAGGGRNFKGDIAIVLWYNRELTAAEISQNYEAFRTRFGV